MRDNKNTLIKNIISLYGFSIAKVVLPLITLPYLTRVLSVESYGLVNYVRSVVGYMQIVVDFGFMLSGTKEIVRNQSNRKEIGCISGNIMCARLGLALMLIPVGVVLMYAIPILSNAKSYFILSYVPVLLSVFLFDYVFRGIEKMHVLTMRFFVMKGVSTILTLLIVKSDADLLWIPVLDSLGSAIAIVMVVLELKRESIHLQITGIKQVIMELRSSAVFFVSNVANTIFGALNTLLIGIFLSSAEVAYWTLCIQLVTAIQTMYQPITDGIYPEMMKSKNLKYVNRIVNIFMPVIFAGCVFTYVAAEPLLEIVGGEKYVAAKNVLRCLIPVMFLGFPTVIFGWPTLGAIEKDAAVTLSTVLTAAFQLVSLLFLGAIGKFTLIAIAATRSITEGVLFLIRICLFTRYKKCFTQINEEK